MQEMENEKKEVLDMKPYERCETTNGAKTLIAYAHSGTDEYVSVEPQDLTIANILASHRSCYTNICRKEKPVVTPEEIQEKSALRML